MKHYNFLSEMKRTGERFATPSGFTQDQVKNEPMFFNSDLKFAYEYGGDITKSFLFSCALAVPHDKPVVFDSRVHMLMPGWFPCIPGWHHDDVPRSRPDGQPNYNNPEYFSKHAVGLVNGEICPTQFATGACTLAEVPSGGIVYKEWHRDVDRYIVDGTLKLEECPSDEIVLFDWQSFHQGQRARKGGWRWFGRLSWDTERTSKITNEIRRQVQVYLEFPMEGW